MHFFMMFSIIPAILSVILLVLSIIGRWKIFSRTGHLGILSLIPGVNFIIYGKIANRLKTIIFMIVLSLGMSLGLAVLGSVLDMTMNAPALQGKAVLVVGIGLAVLSILFFALYVYFIMGLCESLMLGKGFIFLFLFFFPLAEVIVGFSGNGSGTIYNMSDRRPGAKTSSLESFMGQSDTKDDYLEIWDRGEVVFPEDMPDKDQEDV